MILSARSKIEGSQACLRASQRAGRFVWNSGARGLARVGSRHLHLGRHVHLHHTCLLADQRAARFAWNSGRSGSAQAGSKQLHPGRPVNLQRTCLLANWRAGGLRTLDFRNSLPNRPARRVARRQDREPACSTIHVKIKIGSQTALVRLGLGDYLQ